MNINKKTHRQLTIQNGLFYILLLVVVILLAQLSLKTDQQSDWTANNRHTLSDTTTQLLNQLDTEISIQVFITPNNQYESALKSLLALYQVQSDKLNISYINPEFSPNLVRELAIAQQGEMVVSNGDQQVHVKDLSEQSLTNALVSVSRKKEQWLIFIEGHGERSPFQQQNYNFSLWGEQLKQKGFKLQALNLVTNSQIPRNTAAVVIASPEQAWLPGEIDIIKRYIEQGGNIVWLADPNTHSYLQPLADQLGLRFMNGTVLDPNAELLGLADPRFTLVNNYANHPISKAVKTVSLFPQAVAITPANKHSQWTMASLLETQANAWSKAGLIDETQNQTFAFQQGTDTQGPLSIGYVLNRENPTNHDEQQRIAVIGDSDFLSNSYLGNGANLDLGMALINWISGDDALINIPVKTTIDTTLDLSKTESILIAFGFLIIIPAILLLIGFIIWRKRRQR